MRLPEISTLIILASTAFLGCGGGGGSDNGSSETFIGTYNASLGVVSNSCPLHRDNYNFDFQLNQSGTMVVLVPTGGKIPYVGEVTGPNSFQASQTQTVACNRGTSEGVFTVDVSQIDKDSALISITEDYGNCTGGTTGACKILSTGGANRTN